MSALACSCDRKRAGENVVEERRKRFPAVLIAPRTMRIRGHQSHTKTGIILHRDAVTLERHDDAVCRSERIGLVSLDEAPLLQAGNQAAAIAGSPLQSLVPRLAPVQFCLPLLVFVVVRDIAVALVNRPLHWIWCRQLVELHDGPLKVCHCNDARGGLRKARVVVGVDVQRESLGTVASRF